MNLLRVGVIGVGKWGQNHAKTLAALTNKGECELVGIHDTNAEQALRIASASQTRARSLRWLLDKANCDAVTISTPSATHTPLGIRALKKGLDVLVEKPSGLNAPQAQRLADAAKTCSRTLVVGHEFRFHPGILKLKEMLEAGADGPLGRPYYAVANRFVFNAPRSDMGVLHALAIHDIDLFAFLFGQRFPTTVFASVTRHLQPETNIEEHATACCHYANGVKGYANESWVQPAWGKARDFVLVAKKGTVKIDFLTLDSVALFESSLTRLAPGQPWKVTNEPERRIAFERKEPLEEELRHFIALSTGAVPPHENRANGQIGADAVRVIDACLKSAKTEKAVRLRQL